MAGLRRHEGRSLIAIGFRFRRSVRLGPLRFNFSNDGLSSISVGGRRASFTIPVNRRGRPRTTVGLQGTGLPNSRRLRPGQLDALNRNVGLLVVIATPEAMEGYLLRAQGQDDAQGRAQRCIEAVQEASRLAAGRGWLT